MSGRDFVREDGLGVGDEFDGGSEFVGEFEFEVHDRLHRYVISYNNMIYISINNK